MKKLNKAYELCNQFLGKEIDIESNSSISVKFGQYFNENKIIRREDVNNLYFNIVLSILPEDNLKDLFLLSQFIRANDKDGYMIKKIDDIIHSIYNGEIKETLNK